MSFTYVLHARPLRICIRTPSSAPIDRSPGGFWDSAKIYICIIYIYLCIDEPTELTQWGTSAGGLDGSVRPVSRGGVPTAALRHPKELE